jgi:hypothetical protein
MFDVQASRHRGRTELPEEVLASIAGYYRRVTTAARPMNRLVALVMVATLIALVAQLAADDTRDWVATASLALLGFAVLLAGTRTVRNAVRLGARTDPPATQTRLANSILADHLLCLAALVALLTLQLGFAG